MITHRQSGVLAGDATRYMALGDSLAAGYQAVPVTKGYVYRLYDTETFDSIDHTLFANAAVPGASSSDVAALSGAAGADPVGGRRLQPKGT